MPVPSRFTFGAVMNSQQEKQPSSPRPIYLIAKDIKNEWAKPYYGAVPYLNAMLDLSTINDHYGMDNAKGIILYFLSNAASFRGPKAKELKDELKKIAGIK